MLIERVYNSWFFWPAVALYVVLWVLIWGFWQGRKKEYKKSKGEITFLDRYSLWYTVKYPSKHSFFYDLMSLLGPPAFFLYLIFSSFFTILDFIFDSLVVMLVFLFIAIWQTICFLGKSLYSLGRKIGSK